MFLQPKMARVNEVNNRTEPLRLRWQELLDMMPAGQDDGPGDADNVCHEAEETGNCEPMDEQDCERSSRKVDK